MSSDKPNRNRKKEFIAFALLTTCNMRWQMWKEAIGNINVLPSWFRSCNVLSIHLREMSSARQFCNQNIFAGISYNIYVLFLEWVIPICVHTVTNSATSFEGKLQEEHQLQWKCLQFTIHPSQWACFIWQQLFWGYTSRRINIF